MARYRQKDPADLAWNALRRRITRELDLQIAEWREQALNDLLSTAFAEFTKTLTTGETLELEPAYTQFVAEALTDVVDVKVDREAA